MSLGGEAKQLLNNEMLTEAFNSVRNQAIKAALDAHPREDDLRRRLLDAANTVDKVRAHLMAVIQAEESANQTAESVKVEDYYVTRARQAWSDAALSSVAA